MYIQVNIFTTVNDKRESRLNFVRVKLLLLLLLILLILQYTALTS
jgi:hypothetical protein